MKAVEGDDAQHALGSVDVEVSRTLDDTVAEITVTIDELRELARELRPAALDAGLAASRSTTTSPTSARP